MRFRLSHLRALLPIVGGLLLTACETPPGATAGAQTDTTPAATSPATNAAASGQGAASAQAQAQEGAALGVFVADTTEQEGWHVVTVGENTLYLYPEAVLTRDFLTGVQAGANQQGEGLLALALSPDGQSRLTQATTQFPNKRLALVVGQTLLAVPAYTTPVSQEQLVFAVGTEENASAAARAIAGVTDDGADQGENPVNNQ